MALVALCDRAAVVIFMLVVMVSSSASARIAAPTSDYNNLDTPDSGDLVDATAVPAASGEAAPASDEAASLLPWTVGAVRMLRRVYLECRDDDLSSCLKVQVVRAMDRVARSTRKLALGAGLTLERDADAPEPQQEQANADLEQSLPRSLPERERSLDKLILEKLYGFLQNYSLRLKLPSVAELSGAVGAVGEDGFASLARAPVLGAPRVQRGVGVGRRSAAKWTFMFVGGRPLRALSVRQKAVCDDTGQTSPRKICMRLRLARRRRQPFGGMMGLGMLLAGSLLPMKFGMLAMLAGKALMLSKLALLISALMAMRNMGAGGGGSSGGSAHH